MKKIYKIILCTVALAIVIAYAHYYLTDVYNEVLNYVLFKKQLVTSGESIIIESDENDYRGYRINYKTAYQKFDYNDFLKLKSHMEGNYNYSILVNRNNKYNNSVPFIFLEDDEFERIFHMPIEDKSFVNESLIKKGKDYLDFNDFYIRDDKLHFSDGLTIDIKQHSIDDNMMFNFSSSDSLIHPSRFQTIDISTPDTPKLSDSIIVPIKYIDRFVTDIEHLDYEVVRIDLNGTDGEKLINEMNKIVDSNDYKNDGARKKQKEILKIEFQVINNLEATKQYMISVVNPYIFKLILLSIIIIGISCVIDKKYFVMISFITGLSASVFYRWKFDEELYLLWIHAQIYVLITILALIFIGLILGRKKKSFA